MRKGPPIAATLDGGHLNGQLNVAPVSPFGTEKRKLLRNLRAPALFTKIRDAERRMEAGERELGFYLLDLKRRKLYKDGTCKSFNEFVLRRTGLTTRKAGDLGHFWD